MRKFGVRCAVLAALGVAMVVFSNSGSITAANNAEPTIKEIMQKVNGGKPSLCAQLGAVKKEDPKWDELAAKAKELVPLAKAMGANTPPKGDAESWKKLTANYAKAAEDLDKAIAAKDVKAATEAHAVIANCGVCHTPHRPKKDK